MQSSPPDPVGVRRNAKPLHVNDTCTRCKSPIDGWIYVDPHLAVVDTVSFILIGGEPVCDKCYGHTSRGTPVDQ